MSVDQAFTTMRGYARHNNRKLADVALAIIDDNPNIAELARPQPARDAPRT
ncbi:MAG: hypothetical protein JWO75_6906 [Actinomycetia bacterium]|nr:hypothetical protein [Actinomycetes bacterium]